MNKIVKYLTASIMSMFISTAYAKDSLTYYMMTTANSPAIKVTEVLIDKLKNNYDINWKQNVGCSVKNQVEKDPNPMFVEFVPGQYWMSLYDGNNICVFNIEKIRYVLIVENSYAVCVRKDSDINSITDLIAKNNSAVAFPTGVPGKPLIENINKNYNASLKPVMSNNSNSAITALLAKDVDVAFIINTVANTQMSQGTIKCIATTESGVNNSLDKALSKINPAITTFHAQFAIGLKNISDEKHKEITAELLNILATAQFPNGVKVTSLANASESDLAKKVHKITKDLYEATK